MALRCGVVLSLSFAPYRRSRRVAVLGTRPILMMSLSRSYSVDDDDVGLLLLLSLLSVGSVGYNLQYPTGYGGVCLRRLGHQDVHAMMQM